MKKWYLKWWIWLIIVVVALIIPIIINELYKTGKGYVTLWGASDVLAFYGSFLSFIGTIILGVVAMYQSWKANYLSERLLTLEEEKNIPIVDILEIMDEPQNLTINTYRNALRITLNETDFIFKEDNKIDFCCEPVLAFTLKNICANHIISIKLKNVEQCVVFENGKRIDNPINIYSWNGGVRVLDCNETQFLLISGVLFSYPSDLTVDDAFNLGYTSPVAELNLTFELKNIKGNEFIEKIKICFPYSFFVLEKVNFPFIFEKEILSITREKEERELKSQNRN